MRVAILCGGKGTRLLPLSVKIPKAMITVGGMPILEHVMKIYDHFGFNDFVILLGYKGEVIKKYLVERHSDYDIVFVDTGIESETGERVYKARHLLGETFFLTYCDGVGNVNIKDLLKFHINHAALVTVTSVPMQSPFGILVSDDTGKVIDFKEKPVLNDKWINAGFFVFDPEVFDNWNGKILESEIIPNLVSKTGRVYDYKHLGFWRSVDTFKDVQQLNEQWMGGKANWTVWMK